MNFPHFRYSGILKMILFLASNIVKALVKGSAYFIDIMKEKLGLIGRSYV